MKVFDCEFRNTDGTAPECGVDIEPDPPHIAKSILFQRCYFSGNNKSGIQVYKRVSNITIKDCSLTGNKTCGVVVIGCDNVQVISNTIQENGLTGVLISTTATNTKVSENTFRNNYNKNQDRMRSPFTLTGWATKIESDILIQGDGFKSHPTPEDYANIVFQNYYK